MLIIKLLTGKGRIRQSNNSNLPDLFTSFHYQSKTKVSAIAVLFQENHQQTLNSVEFQSLTPQDLFLLAN